MTLTYYERGKIEGKLMGERNALLRMAVLLLEAKFGAVTAAVKERLEGMSGEQLEQLMRDLLRAQSLKDLGLDG